MRSRHVPRAFSIFDCRNKAFDTFATGLGYISDTYQCASALCLEAVPEGYHPPRYPPPPYSELSGSGPEIWI